MSEYQYYEFQAIDRPLTVEDRQALRQLSTRARITPTSFVNTYEWGDFKGDPAKLMAQWFDLHLYLANWGSRRLMIRWPAKLLDPSAIRPFLQHVDWVSYQVAGENLIVDIAGEEIESEDWDDGSGRLAALAPLRSDVMAGDLRLFYLLWLTAIEADALEPGEIEPLPGIGPVTGALEAFAAFFQIDPDLLAAASEQPFAPADEAGLAACRSIIADLPEDTKISLLTRLFEGDAYVATALKAMVRQASASPTPVRDGRTVAELRSRAEAIRLAREQEKQARRNAETHRRAEEAERTRRVRLDAVKRRGDKVWQEIEIEIERRNAAGYDRAAGLLEDLRTIAEEAGFSEDFRWRLGAIRSLHARKARFIERIAALG